MKPTIYFFLSLLIFISCKSNDKKMNEASNEDSTEVATSEINEDTSIISQPEIIPIEHATMILKWDGTVVYVDPVGGKAAFSGQEDPDLILVTDIHQDHLNEGTIIDVSTDSTAIIAPKAVANKLTTDAEKNLTVLNNGASKEWMGFTINAIPMYNLPEKADAFHTKGRGNGYVIEKDGTRVYISGDTEDIPEMRNLKDIDMAFVCMNLPYTMDVEAAAQGVLAFKPKKVYPYHYRGQDGKSDVEKFKKLVNEGDSSIEVALLNWYPKE